MSEHGSGARTVLLDGGSLQVDELCHLARNLEARVELCERALARVRRGREQVDAVVRRYREDYAAYREGSCSTPPVQDYGVTTGFGEFKDFPLAPKDLVQAQRNLLLGHAAGVGEGPDGDDPAGYFPPEVVRATLVVRLNAFLVGNSGVRPELLRCLQQLLHRGIVPLVPVRGSLGSSGDLCPLSHLFGVLLGAGRYQQLQPGDALRLEMSQVRPASQLQQDLGQDPVLPGVKEGLALSNGATLSAAVLALAVQDAENLASAADVAAAMSAEAVCGCARAFDPEVHRLRAHPGQQASAQRLRQLMAGSRLLDSAGAVQDPYSVRCAPVVHGASREAIAYARGVAEREINAATDNPLFVPSAGEEGPEPWDWGFATNWPEGYDGRRRSSYSAGNFHGQPVAMAADFLTIAVAELGTISERRSQMLLDRCHNRQLPANLVARRGVCSGYMLAQYSAASLVMENQVLAHPGSVGTVPTAANIEDHVAGATVAARKLRTAVNNVQAALAVELLVAAQALDWRAALGYEPGAGVRPEPEDPEAEAHAFGEATTEEGRIQAAQRLGKGTAAAYLAVRAAVPPLIEDRVLADDILCARRILADGSLLDAVDAELS